MAVCRSDLARWRKITSSKIVLIGLWLLSIICLLPVIIFSNTGTVNIFMEDQFRFVNSSNDDDDSPPSENYSIIDSIKTCNIFWPEGTFIKLDIAFTLYGCLISFCIPIMFISIFYSRIVICLKKTRSQICMQLRAKQKERRKVTYLVLLIIGIYLFTYLPFWLFQIFLAIYYLLTTEENQDIHRITSILMALFQLLIYLSSSLNPLVYAFMSINFRLSFQETFECNKVCTLFRNIFSRSKQNIEKIDSSLSRSKV